MIYFSLDDCRSIQFMQQLENTALNNHVIRRDRVGNKDLCQLNCYLEPNCVSYNYGPSGDGTFMCELSDHSHQGVSSSDLTERDGFTYTAIKVNYYKNGKFTVPPNYRLSNSRSYASKSRVLYS